ncbi:hypothetical protein GGR55DRAFT_627194 [Xylaria sp. FL0064]|nr:hypothetical protein GGR55DRAFT_627194 [Xylaria sp. FL0064]
MHRASPSRPGHSLLQHYQRILFSFLLLFSPLAVAFLLTIRCFSEVLFLNSAVCCKSLSPTPPSPEIMQIIKIIALHRGSALSRVKVFPLAWLKF